MKVTIGSRLNDQNGQTNESLEKNSIERPFYISESEVTNASIKIFLRYIHQENLIRFPWIKEINRLSM